jgi:MFS family permease
MIEKFKRISYDWLPLSGIIILLYMVQRGFAALAKMNVIDLDLSFGMKVFFFTVSAASLIFGFLADRIKPQLLLGIVGIAGLIGLMGSGYNMILFGLGCGIAASSVKVLPFALPLKNKDSNIESIRIAPQSAAKNIGSGIFYLLLAGALSTIGFTNFTFMMSMCFAIFMIWAFMESLSYKFILIKWERSDVFDFLKSRKWWMWTVWHTIVASVYYKCVTMVIPSFMALNMTKEQAIAAFGLYGLLFSAFRWGAAWIGVKIGYWNTLLICLAWQVTNLWLMPSYPFIGLISFFLVIQLNTPNYWALAKEWFTKEKLGTGIGMAFVITYLVLGVTFGSW